LTGEIIVYGIIVNFIIGIFIIGWFDCKNSEFLKWFEEGPFPLNVILEIIFFFVWPISVFLIIKRHKQLRKRDKNVDDK